MTAGLIHASPARTPEACSSNLPATARTGAPRETGAPPACAPPRPRRPSLGKAAAAGPAGGPSQLLQKPATRAAAKVPTQSGRHLPAPHGTAAPEPGHCADEPRPAAQSVLRIPSRAPLRAIQTPPRAARRDSYPVGVLPAPPSSGSAPSDACQWGTTVRGSSAPS